MRIVVRNGLSALVTHKLKGDLWGGHRGTAPFFQLNQEEPQLDSILTPKHLASEPSVRHAICIIINNHPALPRSAPRDGRAKRGTPLSPTGPWLLWSTSASVALWVKTRCVCSSGFNLWIPPFSFDS